MTMVTTLPISPLVARLCQALNTEAIHYCHWKSNAAIDRSASGENDLDLLVQRADVQRFLEILCEQGFKEAHMPEQEKLPGVRDFYGFDGQADRLIHVHAHFQLVLGHDFTKNYHLPIEAAYIDSASLQGSFKLPAPAFELAVFVIRMVIKHSTLDTILMRHGSLSTSERRELTYLLERTTEEAAATVLAQHLPCIEQDLFHACLGAIQPGASFGRKVQTGGQLVKAIKGCARQSEVTDLFIKFWKRVTLPITTRLHWFVPRKSLVNGGLLMAVIGGDGSGKTTAIQGLYQRLEEEFKITRVHMGKPRWSVMTILIRGLIKVGRTLGFYRFMNEGSEYAIDTTRPVFPGYPWLIREVCTARDRFLTYKKARRLASIGRLVICDRYPLAEVKIMDGPQVERVTAGMRPNRRIKLLAAIEKRYYDQIALPDLLAVLRVAPEISVQRKTDEPAVTVLPRATEVWKVDWSRTPACIVDAGKSKEEVLADLMALVWSRL